MMGMDAVRGELWGFCPQERMKRPSWGGDGDIVVVPCIPLCVDNLVKCSQRNALLGLKCCKMEIEYFNHLYEYKGC